MAQFQLDVSEFSSRHSASLKESINIFKNTLKYKCNNVNQQITTSILKNVLIDVQESIVRVFKNFEHDSRFSNIEFTISPKLVLTNIYDTRSHTIASKRHVLELISEISIDSGTAYDTNYQTEIEDVDVLNICKALREQLSNDYLGNDRVIGFETIYTMTTTKDYIITISSRIIIDEVDY